jgi:hypothetical protein
MKLKAAVAQVARQREAKNALYEFALKTQRSRPRSAAFEAENAH